MTTQAPNAFVVSYIACALWSTTDESTPEGDEPFNRNYTSEDLAPEALTQIKKDCDSFYQLHKNEIGERVEGAGHDFWLTRCGHGAGFWNGVWPEPQAARLTKTAEEFGNVDLYLGDNGKIYIG